MKPPFLAFTSSQKTFSTPTISSSTIPSTQTFSFVPTAISGLTSNTAAPTAQPPSLAPTTGKCLPPSCTSIQKQLNAVPDKIVIAGYAVSKTIAIVSGVIIILLLCCIACCCIYRFCRRKRGSAKEDYTSDNEDDEDNRDHGEDPEENEDDRNNPGFGNAVSQKILTAEEKPKTVTVRIPRKPVFDRIAHKRMRLFKRMIRREEEAKRRIFEAERMGVNTNVNQTKSPKLKKKKKRGVQSQEGGNITIRGAVDDERLEDDSDGDDDVYSIGGAPVGSKRSVTNLFFKSNEIDLSTNSEYSRSQWAARIRDLLRLKRRIHISDASEPRGERDSDAIDLELGSQQQPQSQPQVEVEVSGSIGTSPVAATKKRTKTHNRIVNDDNDDVTYFIPNTTSIDLGSFRTNHDRSVQHWRFRLPPIDRSPFDLESKSVPDGGEGIDYIMDQHYEVVDISPMPDWFM